jgi:hypothetical protein
VGKEKEEGFRECNGVAAGQANKKIVKEGVDG